MAMMVMNPEEDWLKQLEKQIDWKAEKKRVEEELKNLDKLAAYLTPEELEERRRILEYELFVVETKIRERKCQKEEGENNE